VLLLPGLVKKEAESGVKTLAELVAAAGGQLLSSPQQRAQAEAWLQEHTQASPSHKATTGAKGGGRKSRGSARAGGAVADVSEGSTEQAPFTGLVVLGSEEDKRRPGLSLPASCGVHVYDRELLMKCLVRQQRLDKEQTTARGHLLFTL
jgi:hypothetical protein